MSSKQDELKNVSPMGLSTLQENSLKLLSSATLEGT